MSVERAESLTRARGVRDSAYAEYVRTCAACVDARDRFEEASEMYRRVTLVEVEQ